MFNSLTQNKRVDNLVTLPAALRSYIPKQLLRHVDMGKVRLQSDQQYVQSVLDNSNDYLKIYGSAENLLANLQNYMDFPLRRKMFPEQMGDYNYTVPEPYRTLKGDVLYCKQDYLFHLQSCVYLELRLWDDDLSSEYAELIEYMKKHEEQLNGCYEFIKYDHETFESIRELFYNAASLQVIPENAKITITNLPPRIYEYEEKDFVKVFNDLISKYPCIFLPNSETKDKEATAVVRVFVDNNHKFVIESELFAAINLKNPDMKPLECMDTDGHYRIVDYKRVFELFRDRIAGIDFIYHLIAGSQHRAVPIVAPTGDHCVLAADAFLDILRETILVLGVFQKLTRNTCHMIPKFIAILEKFFPSNIKYQYFINLNLFQNIRKELEEFWKPIEDVPVKKVRNVGPKGFTVEDLKKELKYLGYTEIFSEISAEARTTYTVLLQKQKPNEFETKDMLRAIEACLTSVMFKRFPCLVMFMYRQNFCPHRRAEPCELCSNMVKEVEAEMEAEKTAKQSSMKAEIAGSTTNIAKVPLDSGKEEKTCESSKESTPKAKPELKRIDEPVIGEASSIELIRSEDLRNSIEHFPVTEGNSESNPVLPDSNTHLCEKCMETSNEAREEVIETYKKMMILEKTLKENDAELERLRVFEQKSKKVDETEKKIKDLEKEGKEWKMKHLKILEENVKMGNMLKNARNLKELESQLKEKDVQLNNISTVLEEKALKCKELEKTIQEKDEEIHELSETEKSEKHAVNDLLEQLADKDKEIEEMNKEYVKLENRVSKIEEQELKNTKITEANNEKIEKLMKEVELLAKENEKQAEQLKEKNSIIQELKMKNSKIIVGKNEEIEKLKQQQATMAKETKKEMEQLKRNAWKSAEEIKKLTAKITKKEAAENQLKKSNKEIVEKLRKSNSNLQEITKKHSHLETEITSKNRIIQELQKSAEKQVSDQEKAKEELETAVSMIRGVLNRNSPPEAKEKPDTECLICFYEMKPNEKTLKCENCRKIVHFECASKWLKIHRSCAHCRREQLDPNEFPSLQ